MLRAIDELGMGGTGARKPAGTDDAGDLVSAVRASIDGMPEPYAEAVSRFSRRYPIVSQGILDEGRLDLVRDALGVATVGGGAVSQILFGVSLMMMCNEAGLTAVSARPLPRYVDPQGVMPVPPSIVAAMEATNNMVGPVAVPGIPLAPLRCC